MSRVANAEVHLLDIGTGAYGDCVVLHLPSGRKNRFVLIDGGHSSDKARLLEQFGAIFGSVKPYRFDLVVVSHAHSDHVGALPELFTEGHIVADHALLPDVAMAFGSAASTSTDALPDAVTTALALMREEPPDDEDRTGPRLDALALDAASLLPRYKRMIATLTGSGTNVVYFGRQGNGDAVDSLSKALADIGFEVLGPNQKALNRTARLLSGIEGDLVASALALTSRAQGDGVQLDSARVYSTLGVDAVARLGHLVNAQSVVCVFSPPTRSRTKQRILLGGDFQFADVQTADPIIADERTRLLTEIKARAPYAFAKLSHHGSANAVDENFLSAISDTKVVGICCGRGHTKHPDSDTLKLLESHSSETSWVRTDRSGHVTVNISAEGTSIMPVNAKNRAELNTEDSTPAPAAPPTANSVTGASTAPTPMRKNSPVLPNPVSPPHISAITVKNGQDAFSCEIPSRATSMTIQFALTQTNDMASTDPVQIIDPAPSAPNGAAAPIPFAPTRRTQFQIGGGRPMPNLLFVTDTKRLTENLDDTAVGIVVDAIGDGGFGLCDLATADYSESGAGIADALANTLSASDADVQQVVIIGSYDVVPSQQVDSIAKETPPDLAEELRANESDGFIVWSDDPYVDIDRMGLPDLPISRIPDGHNGKFTLKQLQAQPISGELRHGIRNSARKFVEGIYSTLPGVNPFLVSTPLQSSDVLPEQLQTSLAYYMLHGMAKNATSFWGESEDGEFVEAINLSQIPKAGIDIAVLGCCWGALPASSTAYDWKPGHPISGRLQNQSIALTLLSAGARAVIGCTGAHYSPTTPPYDTGAGPLHAALWRHLLSGRTPAEALNRAKFDFAARIARLTNPDELAIANKSLNQFTCLGLGC